MTTKTSKSIPIVIYALIATFLIGVSFSTFITGEYMGYGAFIGFVGLWMVWDVFKWTR